MINNERKVEICENKSFGRMIDENLAWHEQGKYISVKIAIVIGTFVKKLNKIILAESLIFFQLPMLDILQSPR